MERARRGGEAGGPAGRRWPVRLPSRRQRKQAQHAHNAQARSAPVEEDIDKEVHSQEVGKGHQPADGILAQHKHELLKERGRGVVRGGRAGGRRVRLGQQASKTNAAGGGGAAGTRCGRARRGRAWLAVESMSWAPALMAPPTRALPASLRQQQGGASGSGRSRGAASGRPSRLGTAKQRHKRPQAGMAATSLSSHAPLIHASQVVNRNKRLIGNRRRPVHRRPPLDLLALHGGAGRGTAGGRDV